MTYREAIYAIIEAHKKSFATSDLHPSEALFYIQIAGNRILSKAKEEGMDLGWATERFLNVPVFTDQKGYKYSVLPKEILQSSGNDGIELVTYSMDPENCPHPTMSQLQFGRTTVSELRALQLMPDMRPSSDNPYFYTIRVNEKEENHGYVNIYFVGLECVDVKLLDIYATTIISGNNICDLDTPLPIPSDQEIFLIQEALRMVRFALSFPEDRKIDGEDTAADMNLTYTPSTAGNAQSNTEQ